MGAGARALAQRVWRGYFSQLAQAFNPHRPTRQRHRYRGQDALHARLDLPALRRADSRPLAGGQSGRAQRRVYRRRKPAAGDEGAIDAHRAPGRRSAARGGDQRLRAGGSQRAAGSPIHLREFRRRQIERAGSCRSPARGRGPRGAVQSSVPLWRCRPGQDPSDACGRLAYKAAHTGAARYLPLRRKVHVSVHPRTPAEERHDLQGAVPLRRRADDRRRAVHHRQGIDPRGILPHLQRAGGPEPPGGDLRRQIAPRPGGDRGAHAFAPRLGSRGRYPSYELRLGILQSKAEQMKAAVQPKVLEFLAHKIVSNVRELEGGLNRILAHSTLIGRPITLETTQEVLHDLLRANDRRVTIEEIQRRVAEHFNMKLADMHSERRARAVARPRQVAMYLAKQLTTRSLPEIGRKFGNRDHTTVMHAVRKIEELCTLDAGFSEDVELLRRMLEG